MRCLRRGLLLAAVGLCALAGAGCGGDSAQTFSGDGDVEPGGGGLLVYAIPAGPAVLDPLHAEGPSARLIARQIFEPLVGSEPAPFDRRGLERALALHWRHSADYRVWTFGLRDGVTFQDGSPFDGAAVVANANRWRTDEVGRSVLPGLVAADAPSPDTVRLILSREAPDLPRELRDSRLGLVSPLVLRDAAGGALGRADRAGTGPFELRSSAPPTLLVRSEQWWGSGLGLGPALDRIEFRPISSPSERIARLQDGDVQVAAGLTPAQAAGISTDPLIAVLPAGENTLAFERSVRGLRTWRAQSLSGVWLALLGSGG